MKNYKYEIVNNKFHGGRHIAYSNSLRAASTRIHPCQGGQCYCGGPQIKKLDGTPWTNEEITEGERFGLWLENPA